MVIVCLAVSKPDFMIVLRKPVVYAMFIFCRFSAYRKMTAAYKIMDKKGPLPS